MPEDAVWDHAVDSAGDSAGDHADVIEDALATLEGNAHQKTDGIWLEDLTAEVATHLRDWNVDGCWSWSNWPDREAVMPPGTPGVDVGIDLVARRRDDREWIAIQCKSRQLDESGVGGPVTSDEINKFLAASANAEIWAERWLVVNGSVPLGGHADGKAAMAGAELKIVNLATAVAAQRAALTTDADDEACPHCEALRSAPTPPPATSPPTTRKTPMRQLRRGLACSARRYRWPWRVCVPMS